MQTMTWQSIQQNNFTSIDKLIEFLELDDYNKQVILSSSPFSLNLPLRLAKKIEKNNLHDPLFLQFVPLTNEQIIDPSFSKDPVKDTVFQKEKRLLHKYKSRALLLTTSHCTMHCRFCFRKFFPYEKSYSPFEKELKYIENNKEIKEVILSGGDPLSMSDPLLIKLLEKINAIEHIQRIRFHTRFPIGIPERITNELLDSFEGLSSQIYFVVHVNHPNELDDDIFFFLKKIHKTGGALLSHTVLLKGVNDNIETLRRLFDSLSNNGIIPYYLNQLDPVQGSSHFFVPEEVGKKLLRDLRAHLSGYSIPTYVKEIPHEKSKTIIF